MKKYNYITGRIGENLALKHLGSQGLQLIKKNYRNEKGEIDLVMKHDNVLVFVEIKCKIGDRFGRPEEMIDSRKIKQIRRVAEGFLVEEKEIASKFEKYRIDALCLILNRAQDIEEINYYQNIDN